MLSNRPPYYFLDVSMMSLELILTLKGQCSPQDAITQDSNSNTEVPQIGNLPVTLHTPLSSFTAPLHGLLKKGREFIWNNPYQEEFDKAKSVIYKDTTLWHFNIYKPVTVQVDTSQKGLGTALLQDGCPVAFASNALMHVEQHYANIEVNCLSVSLEQNDSTPMSLAVPSLLRVTISLLNRSTS